MKTLVKLIGVTCFLFAFACGKKTIETKAIRKDVTETVFASGTLEPENKYNLTAQSDGYILELHFKEGDTVKKDQVLAVIDNKNNSINAMSSVDLYAIAAQSAGSSGPGLVQATQNLQLAKEKAAQDSIQLLRYKKLYEINSVSKLDLENVTLAAQTSKVNYLNAVQNYRQVKLQTEQQLVSQRSLKDVSSVASDNNQVKAVMGGMIYKKLKEAGDFVRRGEVIAVIGSASTLYTKLSIDEANIAKIRKGQKVIIQLNTEKDRNYSGTVTEIYPAFDELTQSFFCKVYFTEPPHFRISGTQLQANVIVAEKKNSLLIPRNFLGYGNKVNVKDKGNVDVTTGFISNDMVEIVKGINENDILITDNVK